MELYFKHLYKKYVNQGWKLISNAPKYMNIALPDFVVVYRLASFHSKDNVEIVGYKPSYFSYFSFTVYDQDGMNFDSISHSQIKDNLFHIKLGKDIKIPKDDYYCLIYRVYRTNTKIIPQQPIIVINNENILPIEESIIRDLTLDVSKEIIKFLTMRNLKISESYDFFSLPPSSKLIGLFPNPDARYLVLFPRISQTLIIKGKLDRSSLFSGFMVCDYRTTSTIASINYLSMPTFYTFWVSTSYEEAIRKGYIKNTPLLLWPQDGIPMLVYREVRINYSKGIFSKTLRANDSFAVKKAMGEFYPNVQYL